jgi:hypothetical protein
MPQRSVKSWQYSNDTYNADRALLIGGLGQLFSRGHWILCRPNRIQRYARQTEDFDLRRGEHADAITQQHECLLDIRGTI